MPDQPKLEQKPIGLLNDLTPRGEAIAAGPFLSHVTDRLKGLPWPVLNALYVRKQDVREEVVRRKLGERMRRVFELPAYCRMSVYRNAKRINLHDFVAR